jgi:prophage regulatory protein
MDFDPYDSSCILLKAKARMNQLNVLHIKSIATTPQHTEMLRVSPATIWRWVWDGRFPKPFKLSAYVTVRNATEVKIFIEQYAKVNLTASMR